MKILRIQKRKPITENYLDIHAKKVERSVDNYFNQTIGDYDFPEEIAECLIQAIENALDQQEHIRPEWYNQDKKWEFFKALAKATLNIKLS